MYKYETHLHTYDCSACAISSGIEMVDAAKEKGYSGFVITNHFYRGNTRIDRGLSWQDFIDAYRKDYEITRNYGEKNGIQVFFGIEDGYAPGKEVLIYGVTPDKLSEYPELTKLAAKEKCDLIRSLGGITICAHPYRNRTYIPDPDTDPNLDFFDGIEAYNHGNTLEENLKALAFAQKNNLLITSGGDVHNARDFGNAGIRFDTKIKDYEDFLIRLKSGDFSIIPNSFLEIIK